MDLTPSVAHKTRTQLVVEVLREKILSGELVAQQPLRQSALAKSLNVSRIPLREALVQLEAEGLVKFEAHKGATVAKLSADQVSELFELRALIETQLLAKAIPLLTDEDIIQAEAILIELEHGFEHKNSINSWSELNTLFHTRLYEAANQPYTLDVVHGLNTSCDRYIRLHLCHNQGIPLAQEEHRKLLKYCKKRDVENAVDVLRNHIQHAAKQIHAFVIQQVG